MHDAVVDEEFASDNEEQNNSADDIGEGFVELEYRRDLFPRAALEEHEQERGKYHIDRIELCKPRYHDSGKASAVSRRCCYRMMRSADEQQTRNAADSARECHCAYNNALYIDADIAGGVFALAYDRYLVAVLRIAQIYEKNNDDERNDDDIQQIAVVADGRQPTGMRILIDDADLARAASAPPI